MGIVSYQRSPWTFANIIELENALPARGEIFEKGKKEGGDK